MSRGEGPKEAVSTVVPTSGYLFSFPILGVPIYVHRSFAWTWIVWSMVMQAALGQLSLTIFLTTAAAVGVIILVHEAGHAIAAKAVGTQVHALVATGTGGFCLIESVESTWRIACILVSGVLAQLLLFAATVLVLLLFDLPKGPVGKSLMLAFLGINAVMALISIVPMRSNDGALLLDAVRRGSRRA